MTILILTVGEQFAVLSQDSVVSDASALPGGASTGVTCDAEEQQRSAFVGDGLPPSDLVGIGQQSKITVAPHLRMIAGYVGHTHRMVQWDAFLRNAPAAEVWDLNDRVMSQLQNNWGGEQETDGVLKAFHVGWSSVGQKMLAYLYHAESGWKGVQLPFGHHLYPACDPEDSEYLALQELAEPAARGVNTEGFHVAIAKNIYRAFLRGRYVKGAVIGGQLHTARIERDKISVAVAHIFEPDEWGR